jgi:hypothetical protein
MFLNALECFAARAADGLDTTHLPRPSDAKEVYASPPNTIFSTSQTVSAASAATVAALTAQGWQEYVAPLAQPVKNADMALHTLKRGSDALNVYISAAPIQGKATMVNYSLLPLAIDLPFPKDATEIEYDPNRPQLKCRTAAGVTETLAFFQSGLAALGWSVWQPDRPAKDAEATDKGGGVTFVRDQKALRLVVVKPDTGQVKVDLDTMPFEILTASAKPEPVKEAAPAAEKSPVKDAMDSLADDIMKQAQQIAHDAIAEAQSGKAPATGKAAAAEAPEALQPLAGNPAPVPVPSTAEGVDYQAADGTLEFTSSSSVASLAKFYRDTMKPQGWKENKSVINKPNMVVLDFAKDGKDLSLTILQMGASANVSANGSALEQESAKEDAAAPDAGDSEPPSEDKPQLTEKELETEDSGGLPVPKQHSMAGNTKTPFRAEAEASVPAGIEAVLGFYRRELGKRDWKEDSAAAAVKSDEATAKFTSPDGPAVLTLKRKSGETTVSLLVRKDEEAKKSGLMPKTGEVKMLFGNVLETPSTITINKQTIKVGAGVGSKGTDGPTMDLAPGKYKYTIKSSGKPPQSDEVEVGAGEIWGVLIGPGGGLALQMY